tara:strand:+ start:6711 stop:7097 length:387 start_codon:yes stop_codon:yes gene_type:complete
MDNSISEKKSNKAFKIVPIDFLAKNDSEELIKLKAENENLKKEIENLNEIIENLKHSRVSLKIEELSDNQFSSSAEETDEENEEEYYEIVYDNVSYYTDSFDVYEIDENGEVGKIVGSYVDGSVIFSQ